MAFIEFLEQGIHGNWRAPVLIDFFWIGGHLGFGPGNIDLIDTQTMDVVIDDRWTADNFQKDVAGHVITFRDHRVQQLSYVDQQVFRLVSGKQRAIEMPVGGVDLRRLGQQQFSLIDLVKDIECYREFEYAHHGKMVVTVEQGGRSIVSVGDGYAQSAVDGCGDVRDGVGEGMILGFYGRSQEKTEGRD